MERRLDRAARLPAYDDRGVGYHDPDVENLAESLAGVHAGLASFFALPECIGVSPSTASGHARSRLADLA